MEQLSRHGLWTVTPRYKSGVIGRKDVVIKNPKKLLRFFITKGFEPLTPGSYRGVTVQMVRERHTSRREKILGNY